MSISMLIACITVWPCKAILLPYRDTGERARVRAFVKTDNGYKLSETNHNAFSFLTK